MANHRAAHLAAGGDAEPGVPELIGDVVQRRQRAVLPAPLAVAALIVTPLTQRLAAPQALIRRWARPIAGGLGIGFRHTGAGVPYAGGA